MGEIEMTTATGPPAARDQARARQRAYRARQRDGRLVLRIEIEEVPLVEGLVAAGWLAPGQDEDRAAIEHALTAMLELWCVTRNDTTFSSDL